MLRTLIIIFSLLLSFSLHSAEKIEYFIDSVAKKDGEYVKLLGGSEWVLSHSSLALIADDVIIIFKEIVGKDKKQYLVPIFYHDGEEIIVRHVKGSFIKKSGRLVTVIQQYGEGAKLKLNDGSILSIPDYDRYDTGWWLPPYPALITSNGLYMWNLKKGKRVWVYMAQ